MGRIAVISFPLKSLHLPKFSEGIPQQTDSNESFYPEDCVYIFRRNFFWVFSHVYRLTEGSKKVAGGVHSNFQPHIRKNDWNDGSYITIQKRHLEEDYRMSAVARFWHRIDVKPNRNRIPDAEEFLYRG